MFAADSEVSTLSKKQAGPGAPLPPTYNLYIDDTGTRHLDRLSATANTHPKWFALGGLMIAAEDEDACKASHGALYAAWPEMTGPLHVTDMRARRKDFAWLERKTPPEQARFWAEYCSFLAALPVTSAACVIHRPGYLLRGYGSRAGDARWNLCRTAFNIVVERAAKLAHYRGRRLRVRYEGSDRTTDQAIRGYFALLKDGRGLGFDPGLSAKYAPMDAALLKGTLIDLERKDKRSKLMQVADTYVYAVAKGGYETGFDLHAALVGGGRLMENAASEGMPDGLGVKYFCFDSQAPETEKGRENPTPPAAPMRKTFRHSLDV